MTTFWTMCGLMWLAVAWWDYKTASGHALEFGYKPCICHFVTSICWAVVGACALAYAWLIL